MRCVIAVESVSKVYRLGQIGSGTFADDLKVWWARQRGKPNPLLKIGSSEHGNRTGDDLWALRDVSFQVGQGEVLGIIGRNGAGKSTLLKILSRVTQASSGKLKIRGRIASLLEVGTGFHPDLTGRENVYLNGAILGMRRAEIARKFDEIVEFSEVKQFIDTPVKRYSSGMYVRLAFAVAAHLDPEILVLDEVLAVGDAKFQKKCLGKMGEVSRQGRTVLFVSHNMVSVEALCPNVIILSAGKLVYNGPTASGIKKYLAGLDEAQLVDGKLGAKYDVIGAFRFTDREHIQKDAFAIGEPIFLDIDLKPNNRLKAPVLGIGVNDQYGTRITTMLTSYQDVELPNLEHGITVRCEIRDLVLAPGSYGIKIAVSNHYEDVESVEIPKSFDVIAGNYWGAGRMVGASQGFILTKPEWKILT